MLPLFIHRSELLFHLYVDHLSIRFLSLPSFRYISHYNFDFEIRMYVDLQSPWRSKWGMFLLGAKKYVVRRDSIFPFSLVYSVSSCLHWEVACISGNI